MTMKSKVRARARGTKDGGGEGIMGKSRL